MKTYTPVTGFGYYTDPNGHIINKVQLPLNNSYTCSDFLTYNEVADIMAWNAVITYIPPTGTSV